MQLSVLTLLTSIALAHDGHDHGDTTTKTIVNAASSAVVTATMVSDHDHSDHDHGTQTSAKDVTATMVSDHDHSDHNHSDHDHGTQTSANPASTDVLTSSSVGRSAGPLVLLILAACL